MLKKLFSLFKRTETNVYDENGFDKDGFDCQGFNREGFDRQGFDRRGFSTEGVDREGNNWLGYNPNTGELKKEENSKPQYYTAGFFETD